MRRRAPKIRIVAVGKERQLVIDGEGGGVRGPWGGDVAVGAAPELLELPWPLSWGRVMYRTTDQGE